MPVNSLLSSVLGGENIRTICQMSGAHVELNRNAPQNMPEKEFTIRGTPDQIQHAMHLIGEKANVPPPGQGRGPHGGPGGHGGAAPGGPHGECKPPPQPATLIN